MISHRLALAGVVLCGGRSRRMGQDKALIDVAGVPLVGLVADRLAAVADPVMLAPGAPGRLGNLGLPEIEDRRPDSGPLSGLVAAIASSPHELVAAVAVDMPFLSPDLFRLLAERCAGHDAAVPVTSRGMEPLHAVYSRAALAALEAAIDADQLALHAALASLDVCEVGEEDWRRADPGGRFAVNINSREDLALLD